MIRVSVRNYCACPVQLMPAAAAATAAAAAAAAALRLSHTGECDVLAVML
jgi:hypothetical protein